MNRIWLIAVVALLLAGCAPNRFDYVGEVQTISDQQNGLIYLELYNVQINGKVHRGNVEMSVFSDAETRSLKLDDKVNVSCMAEIMSLENPPDYACTFMGKVKQ